MSVDVQTVNDHRNEMRTLADQALDDAEDDQTVKTESRPLNLTQLTKRNGRKRRTPQKALTSDDYHTDSSSEDSSEREENQEQPIEKLKTEDKKSDILEHYRSFMQRNNVDPSNSSETFVRKPNKKLRLTKSVPNTNATDINSSISVSWNECSTTANGENNNPRSSPSLSESSFNGGSGIGGLIPERTMRQNNWAIKVRPMSAK